MRRVHTRLPWIFPLSAALLTGCFNNVVTLAREDVSVNDPSMNPDGGTIPPTDVLQMPPVDVPLTPLPDVQGMPPVDVPPATGGAGSVDLLVVMDTSNSMRAAQDYFNQYASALVSALIDRHGARDVRVAVVTTDLGVGGYNIPSCSVRGGDDAVMNPRLRGPATSMRMLPMQPASFFCDRVNGEPFMTLTAADDAMFRHWAPACHGTVGVGGCGLEQPLEAALRALTVQARPGAPNAGFLRPEATLAVLVVSDEEDGSVRDCTAHDGVGTCADATDVWNASSNNWSSPDLNLRFYNYVPGSTQDPTWPIDRYVDPTRLNRGLLGLKPGHPERVVFGAITGVPLALPTRSDGNTDWRTLLGSAPDGSEGYVGMTAEGPISMRSRNPDSNCATRVVPACRAAGGDPMACDSASQPFAWPARRIAEVARRMDESALCAGGPCRNGMVASICDTRSTDPLTRFAAMVARRIVR